MNSVTAGVSLPGSKISKLNTIFRIIDQITGWVWDTQIHVPSFRTDILWEPQIPIQIDYSTFALPESRISLHIRLVGGNTIAQDNLNCACAFDCTKADVLHFENNVHEPASGYHASDGSRFENISISQTFADVVVTIL
jgi:hypothetical protein